MTLTLAWTRPGSAAQVTPEGAAAGAVAGLGENPGTAPAPLLQGVLSVAAQGQQAVGAPQGRGLQVAWGQPSEPGRTGWNMAACTQQPHQAEPPVLVL